MGSIGMEVGCGIYRDGGGLQLYRDGTGLQRPGFRSIQLHLGSLRMVLGSRGLGSGPHRLT